MATISTSSWLSSLSVSSTTTKSKARDPQHDCNRRGNDQTTTHTTEPTKKQHPSSKAASQYQQPPQPTTLPDHYYNTTSDSSSSSSSSSSYLSWWTLWEDLLESVNSVSAFDPSPTSTTLFDLLEESSKSFTAAADEIIVTDQKTAINNQETTNKENETCCRCCPTSPSPAFADKVNTNKKCTKRKKKKKKHKTRILVETILDKNKNLVDKMGCEFSTMSLMEEYEHQRLKQEGERRNDDVVVESNHDDIVYDRDPIPQDSHSNEYKENSLTRGMTMKPIRSLDRDETSSTDLEVFADELLAIRDYDDDRESSSLPGLEASPTPSSSSSSSFSYSSSSSSEDLEEDVGLEMEFLGRRRRQSNHRRRVQFTTVTVREYDCIVGDHPMCTDGLPLTLDWNYQEERITPIADDDSFSSKDDLNMNNNNSDDDSVVWISDTTSPRHNKQQQDDVSLLRRREEEEEEEEEEEDWSSRGRRRQRRRRRRRRRSGHGRNPPPPRRLSLSERQNRLQATMAMTVPSSSMMNNSIPTPTLHRTMARASFLLAGGEEEHSAVPMDIRRRPATPTQMSSSPTAAHCGSVMGQNYDKEEDDECCTQHQRAITTIMEEPDEDEGDYDNLAMMATNPKAIIPHDDDDVVGSPTTTSLEMYDRIVDALPGGAMTSLMNNMDTRTQQQ